MISGSTRLVALIGDPVDESLSPRMQNAAFAVRALDWAYVALSVAPPRLGEAVRGLLALGFAGANVTAPHKTAVVSFCDELDPVAERAGSVNTLVLDGGRVVGFSTDGEIVADVEANTAAVIGDGGAARAVAARVRERGIEVRVFSRAGDWPPETPGADLIVHATPVRDELLVEPRPGQRVVDLAYRADGRPTALVEAAVAAGCRVSDGVEALLRQGAASFERWTGIPAPVETMRAALGR